MTRRSSRWSRSLAGAAVLAVLAGGCDLFTGPSSPSFEDADVRLQVGWIGRLPRLAGPAPDDPPDAGWPAVGSEVEWVGHIYNAGPEVAEVVPYVWRIDGDPVKEGAVEVPPGAAGATVSLYRRWSGHREIIELALTGVPPQRLVRGAFSVRSDALAVDLFMEAPIAEWMENEPGVLPFPMWASGEVGEWNKTLRTYAPGRASGPAEILDRLRLDRVEILPAGSPWPGQHTGDFVWYWSRAQGQRYLNGVNDSAEVEDQTIVLHELLHNRGIVDLYAYRVILGGNQSEIRIRNPDGTLAPGSEKMPVVQELGATEYYYQMSYPRRLMSYDYHRPVTIDDHTAYGLNNVAGLRSPQTRDPFGNRVHGFSHRTTLNGYIWHVPDSVRLHVQSLGVPLPAEGAAVEVFFDHATHGYVNEFTEEPDRVVAIDADGIAALPLVDIAQPEENEAFDPDVIILRLTLGDTWDYAFLPVYDLNMAYITGDRDVTDLGVIFDMR